MSIAKQTGVYFGITASVMMPVAYLAKWMEPTLWGLNILNLIIIHCYLVIQYVLKTKINKRNEEKKQRKDTLKICISKKILQIGSFYNLRSRGDLNTRPKLECWLYPTETET